MAISNGIIGEQPGLSSGFNQARDPASDRFDLHDALGGLTGEFVAGGTGGDVFAKLRDEITKTAESLTQPAMKNRIIPVNREDHRELKFSFLIVTSQLTAVKELVSYHILILEGTGEKLKSDLINIDNRPVKITRVTSHAYDTKMQEIAANIVASEFKNTRAISAAATVVHDTVLPTETTKIKDITRNSVLACLSCLASESGQNKPFRLDRLGQSYRFQIEMQHNQQGVVYDEQGQPMRSSALLSLSSEKKTASTRANDDVVNRQDALERICEVSGFVNTVWAPAQAQVGFGFAPMPGMMQNQMMVLPTQKFAAEFVITGINTPYGVSTAAVMLALATKLIAADDNNWMQLLIPKSIYGSQRAAAGGRNQDLTDLGALNILANCRGETDKNGYGSPVDMEKMQGKLPDISRYITTIFRQGIITSIDVPECASQSWYLNIFGRAAAADKESIRKLIAAANEVTCGNFSKFFDDSMPIFTNSTRIPLGHYLLGDQVRDIRDIDLVAICNLYRNSPDQIHNWNRAFADPTLNYVTKLAMIEEIISHAVHDRCEINGFAQRNTFSSQFNQALSKGFRALNLTTTLSTPLARDQMQTGVQAPGYIDSALTMATNTFSNTGSGFGTPHSFTSSMGNRFF